MTLQFGLSIDSGRKLGHVMVDFCPGKGMEKLSKKDLGKMTKFGGGGRVIQQAQEILTL